MGTKTVDASGGGIGRVHGFGTTPGKMLSGTFTFTNSYATGGELCDVTEYFKSLMALIVEPKGGYVFSYNPSTKKIQAYNTLPAHSHGITTQVVEEEAVTVTDHVGVLANAAAIIQNVVAVTATSAGPKAMIEAGGSAAAGQVAVDLTPVAGNTALTFNATDAVTAAKVTYLKTLPTAVANNTVAPGSEVAVAANLSTLGALRWFAWGS